MEAEEIKGFCFFMDEILFENYRILKDGSVYKEGILIPVVIGKLGDTTIKLNFITYKLERFICQHLFKLSDYDMLFIDCSHINCFKADNSLNNLKIFNRQDLNNKSGLSVSVHNGIPYIFSFRTPIKPCLDIINTLSI